MKKLGIIFIITFIGALFLQWLIWSQNDMIDSGVWAEEASYVAAGDSRAFQGGAYGYPGGPVIDLTILIQRITELSYYDAILLSVTLFDGLIIALACAVSYALRKNMWWTVALFITISLAPMFQHSTPSTAYSAVTAVLFCLVTLYLIEKRPAGQTIILYWGVIAGLILSIRVDIGMVMTAVFSFMVGLSLGWKKLFLPAIAALVTFIILDPFIWIAPLRHLQDLIGRMVNGYFEYAQTHVSIALVADYSLLAFISMALAVVLLFFRADPPLPRRFILTLLGMSIFLYAIFLTAHSQAMRYFQPVIFIWEALFPLLIFHFVPKLEFSFLSSERKKQLAHTACCLILVLLLVSRSVVTFYAWWIQ